MSSGFPSLVKVPGVMPAPVSPLDTTLPTTMVLHRMFLGASSTAIVREMLFMPPLAAAYAAKPEIPTIDWPEEMLTIEPPPAATMWGIPYLQLQNTLPGG